MAYKRACAPDPVNGGIKFRDSLLVLIVCLINRSKTSKMASNVESGATIPEKPPVDLSKMTVPQLKALCKERRIPGYSKLGKTALIQTLSEGNAPIAMVALITFYFCSHSKSCRLNAAEYWGWHQRWSPCRSNSETT